MFVLSATIRKLAVIARRLHHLAALAAARLMKDLWQDPLGSWPDGRYNREWFKYNSLEVRVVAIFCTNCVKY
jgi:hypothetical protein